MRVLDRKAAIRHIAEHVNVADSVATSDVQDRIVAEYIRQALCDLVATSSDSTSGVFLTKVTNIVRRQLAPIWPELEGSHPKRPSLREPPIEVEFRDPVLRVLEALDDVREIAHVGKGYYLPTPTRLIRLTDTRVIIIGGSSSRMLREELGIRVESHSIARTVDWQVLPEVVRHDETLWQSKSAWLGFPPTDLRTWTIGYLDRASAHLARSASGIREFEIYLPESNANRPQAFRWVNASKIREVDGGVLLCRGTERENYSLRRYWLGTIKRVSGELTVDQEYPIDRRHLRRLQYGFDALRDAPTFVHLRRTSRLAELTFSSLLPPEERRALVAFGRESSPKPGRFPIKYELRDTDLQAVLPLLKKLGVGIRD